VQLDPDFCQSVCAAYHMACHTACAINEPPRREICEFICDLTAMICKAACLNPQLMPSRASIEKRIERLTKELETERDNARCAKHVSIALLYRELKDVHLASEWFLKAARHAIWSELGDKAVMYAQMAVLEQPTNEAMRKIPARRIVRPYKGVFSNGVGRTRVCCAPTAESTWPSLRRRRPSRASPFRQSPRANRSLAAAETLEIRAPRHSR